MTRDERVEAHTLQAAGFSQEAIATQMKKTRRQIQHTLATRLTPGKGRG